MLIENQSIYHFNPISRYLSLTAVLRLFWAANISLAVPATEFVDVDGIVNVNGALEIDPLTGTVKKLFSFAVKPTFANEELNISAFKVRNTVDDWG